MKFLKKYELKHFNFTLVIAVLLLSTIGILAVGSALPSAQTKQIIGVALGVVVMLVISVIDFEWVLNFYWVIYIVNIILLLCVEFFGVNYNGAQRWIDLKFTTFQPSDLTKICLILFFAKFFMNHENRINEPRIIKRFQPFIHFLTFELSPAFIKYRPITNTRMVVELTYC